MVNIELMAPQLSETPDELKSFLTGLSLDSILSDWKEQHHRFKNVQLDGFLDGKSVPFAKSELDQLKKLSKSFRLTNLQLFNPNLKHFCETFEAKTGHVVSANLYFTPHREAQCFDFHFDSQHTFVYQLMGEKTWFFLKKNGIYLKETHEQEHILNSFKRGKILAEASPYHMRPGSFLEFPYCLIHKARNEADNPSAHITFSYQLPTLGDYVKHYVEEILKKPLADRYLERITPEELKAAVKNAHTLKSFREKFRAQEDLKRIEGRHYQ